MKFSNKHSYSETKIETIKEIKMNQPTVTGLRTWTVEIDDQSADCIVEDLGEGDWQIVEIDGKAVDGEYLNRAYRSVHKAIEESNLQTLIERAA